MQKNPKIFHLIQQAHSALFRASDRALRKRHAIGAAQQAILFVLYRSDGSPITRIAEQLQMGKSSLTGLVDRMELAGLVRREQSLDDARSFLVFLEDRGRRIVEQTLPDTKRVNVALLEPFDSAERKTIERFLRHVAQSSPKILSDAITGNKKSTTSNELEESQ